MLHTERHELHGITVVLETGGRLTHVGRFDTRDDKGIHLINVATHDPASGMSFEAFLGRIRRFGIKVERKHLLVPDADVGTIRPLGEL